jgi:hypothetical protein
LTSLKALFLGILLIAGGVALIAGDVLLPGFLYGASFSGLWGLIAPFLLIFLGVVLILGSIAGTRGKARSKKPKESPPPPPPPPS